jgi:hypothetical protein
MARRRVSFADQEKMEHSAEVEAESLYEAAALAVTAFREDPLLHATPGAMTGFTLAGLRSPNEQRSDSVRGRIGRRLQCARDRREKRSGSGCGRCSASQTEDNQQCLIIRLLFLF